ncbi:hypothetical protein SO802_019913 [Lithocarpus litseifolius]|uniref:Uncharacterized protein n=1 Tax=Lithocarpus litseifolius TaxID=425828 RepID=A0AAW2CQ39_9ROSI
MICGRHQVGEYAFADVGNLDHCAKYLNQTLVTYAFPASLDLFANDPVFDEDIGQEKRLGIANLTLNDLEAETEKELDLRLQPSLDMLKIKDKKDRGTLTIKVLYHEFNKEEQLAALEEEKMILEARKKLKEAGVILMNCLFVYLLC